MIQNRLLCISLMIQGFFTVLSAGQNNPPEIKITDLDHNVGELEIDDRLLLPFTVTDADKSDRNSISCDLTVDSIGNSHAGDEFLLDQTSKTKFELNVENPDFTKDEIYLCIIDCTDGEDTTSTTVYVHVVPGQDMYWDFGANINNVDASAVKAGDDIYTIVAVNELNDADADQHQMTYHLESITIKDQNLIGNHGDDPFFQIDPDTGQIIAVQDLDRLPSDIIRIFVNFYATDGEIKLYGRARIQFKSGTKNDRPQTDTLPLSITMPETMTEADSLFTLNIVDDNYPGQTHDVKINCSPEEAKFIFELDAGLNYRLKPGKQVNYETTNHFDCFFVINDGIHDGDTYMFTLDITDVNDVPAFSTSMYYTTINEGPAGSATASSNCICTDEDIANGAEPLTYSFEPSAYSDKFSIDDSGLIMLAEDVDVDGGVDPSEYVLTVYCEDDDGAKATAQVTITVEDINDNAPVVPNSVTMYTNQNMENGVSVIGSLSPTDADSGVNSELSCSATSTSAYASCYTVTALCDVILTCNITFPYGTTVSYEVTVTDHGNPAQTSITTINVIYRELKTASVTTTLETTTVDNYWFHPENIALCVLASLFCLSLLALMTFCCIRYCRGRNFCNRCCEKGYRIRPPTPVTPPRTPTPPPRPKTPIIVREKTPDPILIRVIKRPTAVLRTTY